MNSSTTGSVFALYFYLELLVTPRPEWVHLSAGPSGRPLTALRALLGKGFVGNAQCLCALAQALVCQCPPILGSLDKLA
jgi:hypothetical protein